MPAGRALRYNAARASALVQMLREQGVHVDWTPPREQRDLAGMAEEVAVNLVSTGTLVAIGAAVKRFRQRFPKIKLKVEGEDDGPDDGGFLDE